MKYAEITLTDAQRAAAFEFYAALGAFQSALDKLPELGLGASLETTIAAVPWWPRVHGAVVIAMYRDDPALKVPA